MNRNTAVLFYHKLREVIFEALAAEAPELLAGKVYVAIITNAGSDTLIPIIREKIRSDSVVYSDAFKSYDVLDVSEFHHMRIKHSKLFANQRNHINGIENFWNQAKRRLKGYNGIPRQHFHLLHQGVRMALQLPAHQPYAGNPGRWWFK